MKEPIVRCWIWADRKVQRSYFRFGHSRGELSPGAVRIEGYTVLGPAEEHIGGSLSVAIESRLAQPVP